MQVQFSLDDNIVTTSGHDGSRTVIPGLAWTSETPDDATCHVCGFKPYHLVPTRFRPSRGTGTWNL